MSETNLERVRALFDAFNRRDVAALQACLASDVEIFPIRAAVEGTSYSGPQAAARWVAEVDDSWTDLTVEVRELQVVGDRVVVVGRVRAREPRSGIGLDFDASGLAEFRDGVISKLRLYNSRVKAAEIAGLPD